MRKIIFTAVAFLILNAVIASAQVSIGKTDIPQTFSILELDGHGERGLRLPQLDATQKQALDNQLKTLTDQAKKDAARGLKIFNTTTKCVETWNGAKWIEECADLEVSSPQIFCSIVNPMVSNLTATGVNIKWYNVTTGGTELSPSNLLTSGTYYVSQTFNGTESERVAVEVITDCASTLTAASPCGITASSDNKTFTAIDDPKAMSYEFFLDGNPQGEQSSNEKRFNSAITPATRVTVKYYYPSEFLKPKMIYVEGSASLTATGWKYGEYVNNTKTKALVSNFYMSETTITQAQYEYVMGINPSYFQCSRTFPSPAGDVTYAPSSDKPVESINCPDLMAFCNKLSIMEGKTPCYSFVDIPALNLANGTEGWVNLAYDEISSLHYTQAPEWHKVTCNFAADGYRLPTATEWEYAAHDGVKNSNYYFSGGGTGSSDTDAIDTLVWCRSNNDEQTQAVKGKKPNALGLYSMSGNILEFCWEWDKNPSDGKYTPASTPTGTIATSGSWYRIARGGYWNSSSANCRVAPVNGLTADSRSNTHGFRVVCSAP